MSELKTTEQFKQSIIDAAKKAVDELVKVLKEPIIVGDDTDITADKMKNAVQSKKIAMMDALEMIGRIDVEQTQLQEGKGNDAPSIGFAERNAK